MIWSRILPGSEARLQEVLLQWRGTRYFAGNRAKGIAVDCKEFVVGVLDECYGRHLPSPTKTRRMAPDSGMRDVRLGLREIRSIMAQYPDVNVVRNGTVEPGDVLLVRSSDLFNAEMRPGHGMIAGVLPGTAWHAFPGVGVVQTSIAASKGLVRVYRPGKKGWWAS